MGLKVFIGTAQGRENWLAQCLASMGSREVRVISSGAYELGKLSTIYWYHGGDRFLFLQDSVEVLSEAFWDRLEEFPNSVGLLPNPAPFGCYMGVYERKHLKDFVWPVMRSKEDSIEHETRWTSIYAERAGEVPIMFPELTDQSGRTEVRFGRNNLVLENEMFRKWKGTWV